MCRDRELIVGIVKRQVVGAGHVSVDKDEVEVFRLLSGAVAEAEMGSGNRDSICVVGFIEDAEGKSNSSDLNRTLIRELIKDFCFRSAQQVKFRNDTAESIKWFVRTYC
ncbi:hypothetical protein TNCV_3319231 [Trichonephila clavipes]|nr:hypothetical protein TNCV_3319231 [Trichonephila clavipes]